MLRVTAGLALATGMLIVGCREELMPTPNLYVQTKDNPFQEVPPALQSSRVEVLYATDRAPVQKKKTAGLQYGYERSKSLAFGLCTVEIGRNLSWDQLVRDSRTQRRSKGLPLSLQEIREVGRFAAVPDLTAFNRDTFVENPEAVANRTATERQLTALLSERLAPTPCHEAYIYIHGFNNSFEDAAFVMAGLWHFMGRTGVPIIYTWPAGSPEGALGGYTHDSESGQFTGYHLRQFLRTIASCPDLKKIHLIAHSRGTDVLMTALRELNLEYRAAGKQTRSELKLGNLILAAADLDFEVTSQRITAELLPLIPERMTVYVSATDRAIGAADLLFGSKRRIGQLRWTDLTPEQQKALGAVSQMQVVDVRARTSFLGHSYFHQSPAVSSDVILLLRDNRSPGAENGRPLTKRQDNFWEIDGAYPQGRDK
jgi:esterase/lipase superfamily enzyme